MRILITGSNGMLGSDLVAELAPHYEVSGLGRSANKHAQISYEQADLTNQAAVSRAVSKLKPAIIIHSAALTDVDGCQQNPHEAFLINVKGTEYIARACDEAGATLFFISTDYVFDGKKPSPYAEDDEPNPLSIYGSSKLEAEEYLKSHSRSARIIRTSWLYGKVGRNFFRFVLQKVAAGEELRAVSDHKGAPTYTKDLAGAFRAFIGQGSRIKGCSVYHLANSGETTWFDAAQRLLGKIHSKVQIKPTSWSRLKLSAQRPAPNSVFNMAKVYQEYGIKLRSWEEAFDEFWEDVLKKEWEALTVSK